MTFSEAITSGFRNYATFSGRAARSEYWFWVLFVFLISCATAIVDLMLFDETTYGPINSLTNLALFIPGLAVSVRRLHDIDRTGWWLLIALSIIGLIVLLVWACQKGTTGPNRFGPDPLANWAPRPA